MAAVTPGSVATSIVRQASRLILPAPLPGQAVVLPSSICIRCGKPADGKPLTKTYYWHHPALYLAILGGVLIYVILAMVLRKGIKVTVPFCAHHAQRRKIAVMLAWLLPLVGIANAIVLPQLNADGGIVALIFFSLLIAGIVMWAVVANPIRPRRIDEFYGQFTGFCETFLQQFPESVPQTVTLPLAGVPPPPTMPR